MLPCFSFDFGNAYHSVRSEWSISFLIYSEDNVYTPHPDAINIDEKPEGMTISADRIAWAGLQQSVAGTFKADIRYLPDGFDCDISAQLPERIKGTTLLIKQVMPTGVPDRDLGEKDATPTGELIQYPNALRAPVFPLRRPDGSYTAIASLDTVVRGKTLGIQPDGDNAILELHHHEDSRQWSCKQTTPTWRVLHCDDAKPLIETRMQIAEEHWGLQSWETRDDVPSWTREIGLVLNLHGMHWTGYLFNDYKSSLRAIEYVAERIEGRRVLAYLPAWDGRYNYNWPRYEANERMGGEAGLRELVAKAQALGVHVLPQLGAVSANRRFLPPALHDSASQDSYGNVYVKQIDWDFDRAGDTYRVNANIGHPGFRQFLMDTIVRLKRDFDFDGVFIDINQQYHNDPRFSILEGHLELAKACNNAFDDFLVFGENWYDGLLPAYPILHAVTSEGRGYIQRWPELFDKYARNTYHLIHPAAGNGSTGVYEMGFLDQYDPDPNLNVIPAMGFINNTLSEHKDTIDRTINIAKQYIKRMGI